MRCRLAIYTPRQPKSVGSYASLETGFNDLIVSMETRCRSSANLHNLASCALLSSVRPLRGDVEELTNERSPTDLSCAPRVHSRRRPLEDCYCFYA